MVLNNPVFCSSYTIWLFHCVVWLYINRVPVSLGCRNRMNASESLSHAWLRRKPPKPQPPPVITEELDVAKDNLRCFVERWTGHPNSPYLFDTSFHTISPCVSQTHIPSGRSRQPSLSANSPSPCGSLASLPDAVNTPPVVSCYVHSVLAWPRCWSYLLVYGGSAVRPRSCSRTPRLLRSFDFQVFSSV